eukprot:gene8262-9828_t
MTKVILRAPFFTMLGNLHHLKELFLCQCEIHDEALLSDQSCPSVTSLTLQGRFTTEAQKALLRMCPNLIDYTNFYGGEVDLTEVPSTVQTVTVQNCGSVRVENLSTNLTKLSLHDCDVTDDTVAGIVGSGVVLEQLSFSGSGTLTDMAMRMVGDKYGHCLQRLCLHSCGPVTVDGMNDLFGRCTALTSLAWGGFNHPNPTYLCTALDRNPSLCKLDISNAKMTDEVLSRIAASSLETLNLRQTTGCTKKGLMALIKGCPALKVVRTQVDLVNPLVLSLWQDMRPQLKINP